MSPSASTAVVHLVRQANGPAPFEAFMDSYERKPAGLDHELVLLFKGFEDASAAAAYRERAQAHAPRALFVPDDSLDLGAYMHAATVLEHRRLCFLNSYSELRHQGWLSCLSAALGLATPLAGATGSWGSPRSYSLFQLGWPWAYRGVFAGRAQTREAWHEVAGATSRGGVAHWLFTLATLAPRYRSMAPFPNVHVRTNGFLVEREVFRGLRAGALHSKDATYALENGRHSMTSQLIAQGRTPVVVDRHGEARPPAEWHAADVFCQGGQEDLLVADNQTRSYQSASAAQRRVLSGFAWGSRARPG